MKEKHCLEKNKTVNIWPRNPVYLAMLVKLSQPKQNRNTLPF